MKRNIQILLFIFFCFIVFIIALLCFFNTSPFEPWCHEPEVFIVEGITSNELTKIIDSGKQLVIDRRHMDNRAYGRPPYRLPEKFGLADTIGRKPRCEVGVFIFGQPGFHNAAAVGCVVFFSHGRDLLSCRMSAAGISGASRIAGFGEGTPQQVSREGQNRRIADFGTVVETCSK